jgi:heme/copper-type cytochrome/quinol oxidase subunit 3
MSSRIVADLSTLEHSGFGHRVVTWWGTLAFMALEGMGFVLSYGVFLYIAWLNPQWPVGFAPQPLLWSTAFTVLLVVSLIPNWMVMKRAKLKDNWALRWLLVLMSLVGLVALVFRYFEFSMLTLRWDTNVYGSVLWILLGLHTLHLATEAVDNLVMTAMYFTGHVPEKRFTDADENAMYWVFMVVGWLPLYGLLYWSPRLGGG